MLVLEYSRRYFDLAVIICPHKNLYFYGVEDESIYDLLMCRVLASAVLESVHVHNFCSQLVFRTPL